MHLVTGLLLGLLLKDHMMKSVEAQKFEFPKIVRALEGSCAVISCKFTYTGPKPIIKGLQYKNRNQKEIYNIKNSSSFLGRVSLVGDLAKGDCTVKIDKLNIADVGDYFAHIDSDPPTSEVEKGNSVYLYISDPPKMVSVRSTHETGHVRKGENVALTCQGYGNPNITKYTWYKNNQTSHTDHAFITLYINRMTEDKSGQYYCVAGNKVGETKSKPITLLCIDCKSSRRSHMGGVVTAVVLLIVVTLILAVVTLIWYRKKRASRPPRPAAEEASANTHIYMNIQVPNHPKPSPESPYAALQTHNRCPNYEQIQLQDNKAMNKPTLQATPSYSEYEEVIPFRSLQNKKWKY
ncbi:PREDICTED: cell surface A33 antigen-like [Nanorana parkeri]|uniref:cell surface A33 antigen-like n=1 Tax=Nanorana parkeri TaxID=125878 RepID=UPI0008546C37|nr:PREDICTED: cell surface A33 antigen-like [Nanorana parkeri]